MSKLSSGLKSAERAISNVIPHEHSADRRAAMNAAKEQMDYYQQAKQSLHAENERVASERSMEQQKIHEKQIRALRRNFRAPGFLGTGSGENTSDTLG